MLLLLLVLASLLFLTFVLYSFLHNVAVAALAVVIVAADFSVIYGGVDVGSAAAPAVGFMFISISAIDVTDVG